MNKIFKRIIIVIVLILGILSASVYFMPPESRMTIMMKIGGLWTIYIEDRKMLSESKFDKNLWMEAGSDDFDIYYKYSSNCTRGKMYHDLKKNYIKRNMQKEEILALLGNPDYRLKYHGNNKHQNCLVYILGSCTTWFSGPSKILAICLQQNKLVDLFIDSGNNNAKSFKINELEE